MATVLYMPTLLLRASTALHATLLLHLPLHLRLHANAAFQCWHVTWDLALGQQTFLGFRP